MNRKHLVSIAHSKVTIFSINVHKSNWIIPLSKFLKSLFKYCSEIEKINVKGNTKKLFFSKEKILLTLVGQVFNRKVYV